MTHRLKASLFAALLASTGLVATAQAQTTPGTTTTAPAATPMTPGTMPGTTSTTTTTPSTMGTPPAATTMAPPAGTMARPARGTESTSPAPAAVTTTTAPSRTSAAPVAGANSFTEREARRRIQAKGFGQVTDLKKDDKGIWRGTTTKNGKAMGVALDYQGNVVSQ